MHVDLPRQLVGLLEIARRAGSDDVVPGRAAAARAGHDVVEREIVLVAAILALEAVAQEHVEPGEGWVPGRPHVVLERDHARQEHLEAGAPDNPVVARDDVHALEEDRLDGVLPAPERQWVVAEGPIICVQYERRTGLRRHMDCHFRPREESLEAIAGIF
jgi:hypothetical protein